MHDIRKTKAQLIAELNDLRRRVANLERDGVDRALRRSIERLENLYAIDRDILTARSPETTAQSALHHLRHLIPCRHAAIALIDVEANAATILAIDADQPSSLTPGLCLPLDPRWVDQLRQNIAIVTDNLTAPDQSHALVSYLAADGVTAFASVPMMAQDELIGALTLGADREDFFAPEYLIIAHEVADSLALANHNTRLFRSIADQREQLRALTARLSELQEAERQRLARELHDRVGQNLTALGINLNIIRSQLSPDSSAKAIARLDDAQQLVVETVDRIRDVMAELRPPVLDDYGLFAALRWYAERFAKYTGLIVHVEGRELSPRLPSSIELAIFRITQEALTNVARHARAAHVTLTLTAIGDRAQLVIADDGIGFDPIEHSRPGDRPRWGLMTMRERAEAVDGRVQIESSPGHGARVIISVFVHPASEGSATSEV
jgi:signal transduction histidine kinase